MGESFPGGWGRPLGGLQAVGGDLRAALPPYIRKPGARPDTRFAKINALLRAVKASTKKRDRAILRSATDGMLCKHAAH